MAKQNVSLSDKQVLAHDLFMRTTKTQKEIAELVGVGPDTISDWAKKGKWKELKAANSVTRAQVINNTLLQLKELQDAIGERTEKKYPTSSESDTMIKLGNLIRALDKSLSLPDYISVVEEFLKHLNESNQPLAKQVAPYINEFAQNKARQITG
jgi:transcriptional regulator with XRE-family HTH domain